MSGSLHPIATRPELPYVRYVLEHLAPRVPVMVPNVSAEMPAVKSWSMESLRERIGDREVRVDTGDAIERWKVADFMDRMGSGTPYLRNSSLIEFYPELLPDVVLPIYCQPNWLESPALERFIPPVWTRWVELFISGPATRFPRVHVDSSMTHAWVIGVRGRKQFWAWPPKPDQPNFSIHSEEDQKQRGLRCAGRDLDTFFDHSGPYRVEIGPGDFLFLPTGWWHTAESITEAISISGNFVNDTNWSEFAECWFAGLRHKRELESVSAFVARMLALQPP